jgi:hypothetical protein
MGVAAARARGRKGGRKPKLSTAQVQLAQQLYDAGEKTVAQIAAIFKVPRTTIYDHLDKGSLGGRPRARTKSPARQPVSEPPQGRDSAAPLPEDPQPIPVRLSRPDDPVSPQEQQLHRRLEEQRAAMHASRCSTCGNEPVEARARWQQRQDLATVWLHLDGGRVHERRHCAACQPHEEVLIVECGRCGDGPLVTGLPTNTPAQQWPAAVRAWLTNHGWQVTPEPLCPHDS